MAEGFAKKGWDFALKQDANSSHSNTVKSSWSPSASPNVAPGTSKRSYSTLALRRPSLHQEEEDHSYLAQRKYSSTPPMAEVPIGLVIKDVEDFPSRLKVLRCKLLEFMEEEVYPAEKILEGHQVSQNRWKPHPLVEDLKVSYVAVVSLLDTNVHIRAHKQN